MFIADSVVPCCSLRPAIRISLKGTRGRLRSSFYVGFIVAPPEGRSLWLAP